MKPIRCVIIDDEPLARKGLKEYIGDTPFLSLEAEYDSPLLAMQRLKELSAELLFLDIQMPKITGLEFLKTLPQAPPVIFTTAYPQYALDGFELNALDYLVKPISFERFLKAAQKAKEYYELRHLTEKEAAASAQQDFFFVKVDNKLVKLFFDDVLFVEALQNYVAIYTRQKKYITYLTFKSIEEYLPVTEFIKTHKSYIVSAARIDNIDGNEIRIGDHHIPISRTHKEEAMDKILKGRFLKR
jgi:DNA-binding LytR/AlgR family response regulator